MRRRRMRISTLERFEDRRLLVADGLNLHVEALSDAGSHGVVVQQQWQNPEDRYDVNGDGVVAPLDLLIGVNQINSGETNLEAMETEWQQTSGYRYFDVSGDQYLSPIDILLIVDYLNLNEETISPSETTVRLEAAEAGQSIRVFRHQDQITIRLVSATEIGGIATRKLVAPSEQIERIVLSEVEGETTVLSLDNGRVQSNERWTQEGSYSQQVFDESGLKLSRTAYNGVLIHMEEWFAEGDYIRTELEPSGLIIRSQFEAGRIRTVEQFAATFNEQSTVSLDPIGDITSNQIARSLAIPIKTSGVVVQTDASAFLADPLFELRHRLGLRPADASLENRLGLGEKWLHAAGGRHYLLLPDGRLIRQVEAAHAAQLQSNLIATLSPAIYADPRLLWHADGLSVDADARIAGGNIAINVPSARKGVFTISVTATGESSSITRYFDVAVDNDAYLSSYSELQDTLASLRSGNYSAADILAKLRELEASVDDEFLTDLSVIRQEVDAENLRLEAEISSLERSYAAVREANQTQRDKLIDHDQLLTEAIAEYRDLWNARARIPAYVRSQLVVDGALAVNASGNRSFVTQRSQSNSEGLSYTYNTLLVYGDSLFTVDAGANLNRYSISSGAKTVMTGIHSRVTSVAGKDGAGNVYALTESGRVHQLADVDSWRLTGNDQTPVFNELFTRNGQPFAIRRYIEWVPGRTGPIRTVKEDRYWYSATTNQWQMEDACPQRVFCQPPVPDAIDVNSLNGIKEISVAQLNAVTERVRAVAQVVLADSGENAAVELKGLLETLDSGVQGYAAQLQSANATYSQQVTSIEAVRDDRLSSIAATRAMMLNDYNSRESQEVAAAEANKTGAGTEYSNNVSQAQTIHDNKVGVQQTAKTIADDQRSRAKAAAQEEHDRRASGDVGGFSFTKPGWAQNVQDTADAMCGDACDEAERLAADAKSWLNGRLAAIEATYDKAIATANNEIKKLGNWLESQKNGLLKKRDDFINWANDKIADAKEYYQEKRESTERTYIESKAHWNEWFDDRREELAHARDEALESAIVTIFDDGLTHLGKIATDVNVNVQSLKIDLDGLNIEHENLLSNLNTGALTNITKSVDFSPPAALEHFNVPLDTAVLNGFPIEDIDFEQLAVEAVVSYVFGVAPIWVVSLLSPAVRDIVEGVGGEVGTWDNNLAAWWHSIFETRHTDRRTRTEVPESPDEPSGPSDPPAHDDVLTVTVQSIIVSDDDGGQTSTFLGTSSQRREIQKLVDEIYEDAKIQFDWLDANHWNDTFANQGVDGSNRRNKDDLLTVRKRGDQAGVGNEDFLVIDMYFVNNAPGFEPAKSESAIMGMGGVRRFGSGGELDPDNTSGQVMIFVGKDLLKESSGRETVALVVAHELGHALGLSHECKPKNVMYTDADSDGDGDADICDGSSTVGSDGTRLTKEQREKVYDSIFARESD